MIEEVQFHSDELKERWVCYTDLLGIKEMILGGKWGQVLNAYSAAIERVKNSTSYEDRVRYVWFSDTFVMYSSDGSVASYASIDQMSRFFLYFMITARIPLRGSIAFGEYYADAPDGIHFGKALIEAYQFGEAQNWIGLIQCPSAVQKLRDFGLNVEHQMNFPFWKVPIKPGRLGEHCDLPAYRIGEHFKINGENQCLAVLREMLDTNTDPSVRAKYTNTIEFIEKNQLHEAAS